MLKSPRVIIAAAIFAALLLAIVTLTIFGVGYETQARLEGMLALVFPALLAESAVQIQRKKSARARAATNPPVHKLEGLESEEPTVPEKPLK